LNEALRAERPFARRGDRGGTVRRCHGLLRDNVHGVGARLPVQELMQQATGKTAGPRRRYLRNLEAKYLEAPVTRNAPRHFAQFQKLQAAACADWWAKAIGDFGMIADGDRVMVCLSGGKDSYTLLDILLSLKRCAPSASTDRRQSRPEATRVSGRRPARYLNELGVRSHVIEQNTYSVVKRVIPPARRCRLCSRLRRGALYRYAAENGITRSPWVIMRRYRGDAVPSTCSSAPAHGDAAEASERG